MSEEARISDLVGRYWGAVQPIHNRHEIVTEICERLASGEPLATMCRESTWLPAARTIHEWMIADEAIGAAIGRARDLGEQLIAAELREVAAGKPGYSSGDVARDKLMIDTDLKLLAKWNPKRWGDNVQLRHADADGQKLDTAPLVNELLTLLPGGMPMKPGAPLIEQEARSVRNVTPQAPLQTAYQRRAYRPRQPAASDIDDLV